MGSDREKIDYSKAGVDLTEADEIGAIIGRHVKTTYNANVLGGHGLFGSSYELKTEYKHPVLVSSADGVGTKLDVAQRVGRHTTVGFDIVNHCINDIAAIGGDPLYFLDYIAYTEVEKEVLASVIEGLANACKAAGIPLVGGETAQMPGYYPKGKYDLIGFITGVYDRDGLITGTGIADGDLIVGLSSNGLHTNGYSLARYTIFEKAGYGVDRPVPGSDTTAGELLLRPHRSYYRVTKLVKEVLKLRGIAHITGGGIPGNISRIIPDGLSAVVDKTTWTAPAIFDFIQDVGNIDSEEMYRVFNMGIGYVFIIPRSELDMCLNFCEEAGEVASLIGEIIKGEEKVIIK